MGIFNKLTDAIKDAAPVIGGVVGFGLGGPLGAGIGSGIGGLVAGQDVEDAMKTALIGGALGYGASKMGATQFLRPGAAVNAAPAASGTASQVYPASTARGTIFGGAESLPEASFFDKALGFAKENPLLTTAGLGSLAALGLTQEEEKEAERRPFPEGEMFDITARSRETGDVYQLTDPEDLADYRREISDFSYGRDPEVRLYHGGEVNGPGTGTSDSVPARLSDGEFVMTAKAVRGAGGGDRDIGAARMYDMMAELEAQA